MPAETHMTEADRKIHELLDTLPLNVGECIAVLEGVKFEIILNARKYAKLSLFSGRELPEPDYAKEGK